MVILSFLPSSGVILLALVLVSSTTASVTRAQFSPCQVYFQADGGGVGGDVIQLFQNVTTVSACANHCFASKSPLCVSLVYSSPFSTGTEPGNCYIKKATDGGSPFHYNVPGELYVYTGGANCVPYPPGSGILETYHDQAHVLQWNNNNS